MIFQSPAPTRFDLNFSLLGIPVRVHPLFWLLTLLLGPRSNNLLPILIWVLVVFISIIVHEMGHALAFRRYGLNSRIVLHFAGGLAIPESAPWGMGLSVAPSPMQQVIISLAGPFAGFILALLIVAGVFFSGGSVSIGLLLGFIPIPQLETFPFGGTLVAQFIGMMLWVNVFWGLINLLPVFPLDGGQATRNIFIQYDPFDGARKSLWLSVITGGLMALAGLLFFGSIYMALLFGLLAFQSYQSLSVRY